MLVKRSIDWDDLEVKRDNCMSNKQRFIVKLVILIEVVAVLVFLVLQYFKK